LPSPATEAGGDDSLKVKWCGWEPSMSATRVDPQRVSWKTKLRIVCSVEAKRERERERWRWREAREERMTRTTARAHENEH